MCNKCNGCGGGGKNSGVMFPHLKVETTFGTDGASGESPKTLSDLLGGFFAKLNEKPELDWTSDSRVDTQAVANADKLVKDVADFVEAYKDTAKDALAADDNLIAAEAELAILKTDFESVCDELATAKAELEEAFADIRRLQQGSEGTVYTRFNMLTTILANNGYSIKGTASSPEFSVTVTR